MLIQASIVSKKKSGAFTKLLSMFARYPMVSAAARRQSTIYRLIFNATNEEVVGVATSQCLLAWPFRGKV